MLRDIAFLVLIYLVIRFVRGLFTPVRVVNNNFQSQAGPNPNMYRKEEGRVEVKDVPTTKSRSNHHHSDDGEYIDYKEV